MPDAASEARILETLRHHDQREGIVLAAYRRLVDECADEGIQYLGRLIIEDEERHHQLIMEMANRIESWIHGSEIEASTPSIVPRVDPELLDATHQLIGLEHQDATELPPLEHELRSLPATSLLPFLVKLMLEDTARHIEILQFIRTYAG